MSSRPVEERIAQLMARAQAQRLAAQLAIFEAREQLAPLRSAAGVLGVAARALSPKGTTGSLIATASRFLIGHPWLASAVTAGAWRLLRRRPISLLIAVAAGTAAWWLFRPIARPADGAERQE